MRGQIGKFLNQGAQLPYSWLRARDGVDSRGYSRMYAKQGMGVPTENSILVFYKDLRAIANSRKTT